MNIQMLSPEETTEIEQAINRFASLDAEAGESLINELFSRYVVDSHVEVRFFPCGPNGDEYGPVETLYFEVTVEKNAPFHEELGVYGSDNIRNGGPMYEALADELETIIEETVGITPSFITEKGMGGTFTASVPV